MAGNSQPEAGETPPAYLREAGPYTTPPDEFGRYKRFLHTPAFVYVPPERRTQLPVFPLAASADPPLETPDSGTNGETSVDSDSEALAKRLLFPLPNVTQLLQGLHHYSTSGNSNGHHDRMVDIMRRPDFNTAHTAYMCQVA